MRGGEERGEEEWERESGGGEGRWEEGGRGSGGR